MSGKVKLEGFKEVGRMLSELPDEINKDKIWADINFKRSKVIVQRAKMLAPEGPTGNLVDSIGSVKLKKQNLGTVWTGPQRRNGRKGFAGHLNEYGTKERRLKKRSKRVSFRGNSPGYKGKMKKNPFMHKAFDQTRADVQRGIEKDAAKIITRIMKKHAKAAA